MEGPWARLRTCALAAMALVVASCGGAATAPSPTAAPTAALTAAPTAAPTNTSSAGPSVTAPPSPAPTAASSPTAAGPASYCVVRDVLTPNGDYADHGRTYLDWTYSLPETYMPPDLVNALTGSPVRPTPFAIETLSAADVHARRGDPAYSTLLADAPGAAVRTIAFADLAALRAAALNVGSRLVILSAYRSFALQQKTFDYWVSVGGYDRALRTSARPGHSEHQLGTVVDFGDGTAAPWEYADWATTPAGAWLAEHAAEYGFVMSYPKGQTAVTCYDYEPWHYRWVGKDLAMQLKRSATPLRVHQSSLF